MKIIKFIVVSLLLVSVASAADAAPKKEEKESVVVTQTYNAHVHCEACKAKVMNTLPFKKGVKDVVVDLTNQIITVKYDNAKSSDDAVIKALKRIDVSASVKSAK